MKKKLRISSLPRKTNGGVFMIALLIAGLSALSLQASDSSVKKITLIKENVRAMEVFSDIEKQSGYKFFYNNDQIDVTQKVSIHVQRASLTRTLDVLFKRTNIAYKLLDDYIVLTRRKELSFLSPEVPGRITNDLIASTISSPSLEQLSMVREIQNVAFKVSGKVSDDGGQPLPGVNIIVKGTSIGTTSDADGKYSLEVPEANGTLVFTFIGYVTQEVSIAERTIVDISLVPDIKTLSEVVVVGYGEQKKVTVTGAIASVKGDDIKGAPVASVTNTLVGRMPGLIATNTSGEPGRDDSNLLVRGLNSLGDNSPLVVVDGVADREGGFSRIDANDIESVTILKDASAAIYGARGANGVILVTTKRGKQGATNVTYSFNYGLKTPTVIPKMTNSADYATALNEVQTLIYGKPAMYTDAEIQKFRDGSDPLNYPNVNQFHEALKKYSPLVKHNINVSGGGEKVKFFTSVGTVFEDNYYKNSVSNYKQYNLRTNIDADVTKSLKVIANVSLREQDRNSPYGGVDFATGSNASTGTNFRNIVQGDPRINVVWPGGYLNAMTEEGYNPRALINGMNGYQKDKWMYINADLSFRWNPEVAKGLGLEGGLFFDRGDNFDKVLYKSYTLYTRDQQTDTYIPKKFGPKNAELSEAMSQNVGITQRLKLNYVKIFGNVHSVNAFVAYEQNVTKYNDLRASRNTFGSAVIEQINAGPSSTATNYGTGSISTRRNYFGRVDYSYAEKYLVQVNWRYDGSMNFPKGDRYGFFPGVSLGWRLSEEDFWKSSLSFIDYFKIRGSWGKLGNDRLRYNGADQHFPFLTSYTPNWPAAFGGASPLAYAGIQQVQTANKNITWEVATTYNLGFESKFLGNAFTFEMDIFKQQRDKILYQPTAAVPDYAGLSLPPENYAKCESHGIEMSLNYTKRISDVILNVGGNISYAKSKIVNFNEPSSTPEWQKRTGKPINSNWLVYDAVGIFRTQQDLDSHPHLDNATLGDLIYRDVDGNGVIDGFDQIRPAKTTTPQIIYGINLSAKYKNFELSMLWQGGAKFWQYVFYEAGAGSGTYTQDYFNNRWTPENPNSKGPRIYDREVTTLGRPNTYLLHNSSYLRLKNVQLAYTIPNKLVSKLSVKDVRLFVSGFNLITITGIKDIDPEAQASSQGYSGWFNIQQKNYNAGLSVTF